MNIIKWLDKNFEKSILIFLLMVMTVVMFAQVAMRYILNNPLTWAEELTRYCFICSTFLTISYCIRRDSSLKIDILLVNVPKSVSHILNLISKALILIFFIYLSYISFDVTASSMASGQISPALDLPMYYLYAVVSLGFCLTVLRTAQSIYFTLTKKEAQ